MKNWCGCLEVFTLLPEIKSSYGGSCPKASTKLYSHLCGIVWFGPCLMLHFIAHIPTSLEEKLSVAAHLNHVLVFVASLAPLVLGCGTPAPFAFSPPASSTVAPPGCRNVDQRTVNRDQMNLCVFQLHFYINKIKISTAESFQMNKSFVVNVNRIIWLHLMLAFNTFHTWTLTPSCGSWVGVSDEAAMSKAVCPDGLEKPPSVSHSKQPTHPLL